MDFLIRLVPVLLVASALAQYEGFEGYEGHGFDDHQQNEHHHQSLDEHHGSEYELDYHAHPKYSFDYSVKDPHTGDEKEHWETRDGDKVKGSYTLVETDGTKRVVEYEADDKNGFNAVVHKIGTPKHEEPSYKEPAYKEAEYEVKEPSYKGHEAGYGHAPAAYGHEYEHGYDDGFVPSFGH